MTNLTLKRYILKTLKLDNYKRDYRLTPQLPKYLNDTLIGLLLSDGGLQRSTDTSNIRLSVTMSIKNYAYIFHLYNLFELYIDTDLKVLDINSSNLMELGKKYTTVRFKTISMPQLLYYYNISYKKNIINNKFEKIVPLALKNNFNAISLAHLIMGDGNYLNKRDIILIYTNSFTEKNVKLLSNIIKDNIGISNKVVFDRNDQYIIVIEKENISITLDLLFPYMHPSMLYKLGVKENIILNSLDVGEAHSGVLDNSYYDQRRSGVINNKFDYFNIIDSI
jgi:hypothetical protein